MPDYAVFHRRDWDAYAESVEDHDLPFPEEVPAFVRPQSVADVCLCCRHLRSDHLNEDDPESRACMAELFTVLEEVLTDCPCALFVDWPPGAEAVV